MDLLQEARLDGDAEDELTLKKRLRKVKLTLEKKKAKKGKSLVENQMKESIWLTSGVLLNCTISPGFTLCHEVT